MKVEIYSDIVCPWCYIGERRFKRALAEFSGGEDVEVVFRPYQLDPEAPETAVPVADYLERRFGGRAAGMQVQVGTAAAAEGITIRWDRALTANTRTAHRLLRLAEHEYGADTQRALMDRLFDLHFTRGGDLGDVEQLVEEAVAVGMDRERARSYLISGKGAQALEAEFDRARALGIRAVPTFVFDGRAALQGAQPPEKFLEVLEEMAEVRTGAEGGEGCENGACGI